MMASLSSLLEDGEILKTPFYGTIEKIGRQRHNWFSYFTSLVPNQLIIYIKFNQGNDVRIRVAKKLMFGNLSNQEANVTDFIAALSIYQ